MGWTPVSAGIDHRPGWKSRSLTPPGPAEVAAGVGLGPQLRRAPAGHDLRSPHGGLFRGRASSTAGRHTTGVVQGSGAAGR